MRTCVGCRRTATQHELVRVARTEEGSLAIGRTLPGRGAWLCAGSVECAEQATRRRAWERALRAPVSVEATSALLAHLRSLSVQDVPVREDGQPLRTTNPGRNQA